MGVLDDIRRACRTVAEGARSVRIDDRRLAAYARELTADPPGEDDPSALRLTGVDDTVAFVVALDAVNFGSGWFPVLRKPAGSGYRTVAAALRNHCLAHGPPSAGELAAATSNGCAELFGQDPAGEVGELMARFAESWRQLGDHLLRHHGGSAVRLVESATGSAERLVVELARMPAYADRRWWRGIDVPFYKRAQITASDLARALAGAGPGRFGDLDRLTLFADNLVPHVLRLDGVLVLDPALTARIDAGVLLDEGSEEEVELRAGAVEAVERIVGATGGRWTSAELDSVLWGRGQGRRYKAVPRPRCRTMSY